MVRATSVPMPLLVLASGQAGLVSTRQCDDEGLGKDRRHRLVASGRALLVTSCVLDLQQLLAADGWASSEDGPDRQRRRAACLGLLAHGPRATAVGAAALVLLNVQGLPQVITPEVMLPGRSARRTRAGIVVRRFDPTMPALGIGPFRVAAPTWALAQTICELDRDHAVAVLDSALQRGTVTRAAFDDVRRLARGRRGAARLHDWWHLVDGRSQSPLETRARLQCIDAGIPPDELQLPLKNAGGRLVALADLGWRLRGGRWLVAEIDGAGPHATPQALYRDRERQNAVNETGVVDMLRFTAEDIGRRSLATTIKAHLTRDRSR